MPHNRIDSLPAAGRLGNLPTDSRREQAHATPGGRPPTSHHHGHDSSESWAPASPPNLPTRATNGATPPSPKVKARAPARSSTVASYQQSYMTRLGAALKARGLSEAHLFRARGPRVHPAEMARKVANFRVAVLQHEGQQVAVANTLSAGGSGKFSIAMKDTGELLAAKMVRTEDKPTAKTSAMQPTQIDNEVRFLRRYFDPAVTTFSYGQQGKRMILMPLGLTDLARLSPRLQQLRGELAQQTLAQVAGQLGQMHADGLVHNDVKPANIVLMSDGRVRLIDMGEAQKPQDVVLAATPMFGAPESLRPGGSTTTKADIWSLGLTVALVCHPPPAGLVSTSSDPRHFLLAQNALLTGLSRAKGGPATPHPSLDLEEDSQEWEAYFRAFRAAHPQLVEVVLDHMLVPVEQRADAESLASLAATLPGAEPPRLADTCRQLDQGPGRQSMRLALSMRLADEAAFNTEG